MTIGRTVLELAPAPGNPRNSEGAFLRLKDGRILFVYSRFEGDAHFDHAPACIAARTSADDGETWSGDRILFRREDFGAANLMSVSLLRMADGQVGLFFLLRYGWDNLQLTLFRSGDEGETWSAPRRCYGANGYYVTNNDRVIRLKSGRILAPANLHRNTVTSFDSRGVAHFFLSDDDGQTFRDAKDCIFPPTNKLISGLQETGVVELENGVLWAFMRTSGGCHYQSFSFDSGDTWTDAAPSRFTGPCSPLSMKRLADGRLLAVYNPRPEYNAQPIEPAWERTPLVAETSSDDGKTWSEPIFIEDESEPAAYCYTAILAEEDMILLAYCAGSRADKGALNRTRIKKIQPSELK